MGYSSRFRAAWVTVGNLTYPQPGIGA